MSEVRQVLQDYFGFSGLRPGQEEVIGDVLGGESVVAVMPTGAGKSLCYQLPAVVLARQQGFTLVVSPLIALMKDQVDGLRERSIATAALTSAASPEEQQNILQGIRNGRYDLIYVAPERFHSTRFMETLHAVRQRLALLAIDEAHCISEWGHEFRPAYRMLGAVIQHLNPPRLLAVTATATPEVRKDIADQLGILQPRMHVRGFARPELCFSVENVGGGKDKTRHIIKRVREIRDGSVLVYAATRKNAEKYASCLCKEDIVARAYHAGLDDEHRSAIQDEFMRGDVRVVVATNAFGMGVDKTDVRCVIHADLPRSLEAYYQEAGRGGRDKKDATCTILFNHGDVKLQQFLIDANHPSAELLRAIWKFVRGRPETTLQDLSSAPLPDNPHDSTIGSAVRILCRHGFLEVEPSGCRAVQPDTASDDRPSFDPEESERRRTVETAKLRDMIDYAYHTGCRHRFILNYFGEKAHDSSSTPCETCDNCQGHGHSSPLTEAELEQAGTLLKLVAELGGRFGRKRIAAIANGSDCDDRFYHLSNRSCMKGSTQKDVLNLLHSLEAGRLIEQTNDEYPTVKVSARGRAVVRGSESLSPDTLTLVRTKSTLKSKQTRKAKGTMPANADPALIKELRTLRTELAQERSVPAYVVFSNRTMEELAAHKPTSEEELSSIHGLGASRIENYGNEILACLRGQRGA